MYGLPQAGLIVNELLEKRLGKHEYTQSKIVPVLCTHKWRPIQFTLVVDAFGVKYVGKDNSQHLISALQEDYTFTHDWEGKLYVGSTLDWYRKNHQVNISIPGYIKAALQRFNHPITTRHQDSPLPHTPHNYGAIIRYTKESEAIEILNEEGKKFIQQVSGNILYLTRVVDINILKPLSTIR